MWPVLVQVVILLILLRIYAWDLHHNHGVTWKRFKAEALRRRTPGTLGEENTSTQRS